MKKFARRLIPLHLLAVLVTACTLCAVPSALGQEMSARRIAIGNLVIVPNAHLSPAVAAIGDLNGDGRTEVAIAISADAKYYVAVLFMAADGSIDRWAVLDPSTFGFRIEETLQFGANFASPGDVNLDGIPDLIVEGATGMYTALLRTDGSAKALTRIEFPVEMVDGNSLFGPIVAMPRPVGEGGAMLYFLHKGGYYPPTWTSDLEWSDPRHTSFGDPRLFRVELSSDGAFESYQSMDGEADLDLRYEDLGSPYSSASLSLAGDVDGDGQLDLAVLRPGRAGTRFVEVYQCPTPGDGSCTIASGGGDGFTLAEIIMLLLHPDGSVKAVRRISAAEGILADPNDREYIWYNDLIASAGDVDGNGEQDFIVYAEWSDQNRDGTGTTSQEEITHHFSSRLLLMHEGHPSAVLVWGPDDEVTPGLPIPNRDKESFGRNIAALGDLDSDGRPEFAITAYEGSSGGALWIVSGHPAIAPTYGPATTVREGKTGSVVVNIEASSVALESLLLGFRRAGDQTFLFGKTESQIFSEGTAGIAYSYELPAFAYDSIKDFGLEVVLQATDEFGNTYRNPSKHAFGVSLMVEDGLAVPVATGTAADGYRLFSVPLDLDERDPKQLFGESLGPYDARYWRMYGQNFSSGLAEISERPLTVDAGDAFFLLRREGDAELRTGSGRTVDTSAPFRQALQPGWNLVGNPFTFSVPRTHLALDSGGPVDLRAYEGAWSIHDRGLEPMAGYALYLPGTESDSLIVRPDIWDPAPAPATKRAAAVDANAWSIGLRATRGRAQDIDSRAVVKTGASEGMDAMDRVEPPPIGDYLSVAFEAGDEMLAVDARPVGTGLYSWPILIRSESAGAVHLTFDGIELLDPAWTVTLTDEVAGVELNLRKQSTYEVVAGAQGAQRRVTLSVTTTGIDAPEKVPSSEFVLDAPFPNPFTGASTITYRVPKGEAAVLTVFDVLGRRVRLLDGAAMNGERQAIVWDGNDAGGRPVPSGMYFVRLEAGGSAASQTLVRVR